MYNINDLLIGHLPPLNPVEFDDLRRIIKVPDVRHIDKKEFKNFAVKHFIKNKSNNLSGFESFTQHDILVGCQQYIDNLISKKGIEGLQIFEHDYKYYQKLDPNIKFVTPETIDPTREILIAMPFPGHLGTHREMRKILDICNEKNINVHLDCAWLVSAFDIDFDFNQPCVKSFAMSLSKAYSLHWNKVGIRWSRTLDNNDSVTILNKSGAISKLTLYVAKQYMEKYPIDYLCQKYKNEYFEICKSLKLRPSNIIHACFSMDRNKLYGLKNLLN